MNPILRTDRLEHMKTSATETLDEYFERHDSPAPGSPIGEMMARIAVKRPELSWDENRQFANQLQQSAAGRDKYIVPRIQSLPEIAAEADRLRQLRNRKSLPAAA
jgi:hypothetical protein